MTRTSLVGAALAALTSVAALSACGDDPGGHDTSTGAAAPGTSSTQAASGHNAADVAFAQGMIPHHAQAVEMAELVGGRTDTPEIVALAERVRAAQDPEIATMTGWLRAWGEPTAAPGGHPTSEAGHGSDHDSAHGSGMMTDDDMAGLRAAGGADFDRRWLSLMVVHHQGAVEMARTELAEGAAPEAKAMAQAIVDAQEAEIREMRALLSQG